MSKPSKELIDSERKRVNALKSRLEGSFRKTFRDWQVKAFRDYDAQRVAGLTVLFLDSDIVKDLGALMKEHYWTVAEAFIPALTSPELKQSIYSGTPIDGNEEDDDQVFIDFLIPTVLDNIRKSIDAQISLQFPVHHNSIIGTTNRLANDSLTIARKQKASFATVLTGKMIAREITVSITETDWIAEASNNSALEATTTAIPIATQEQLKDLQNISPNVTLRETNIEELFTVGTASAIDTWRRTISQPMKMWVTMGDKRVRKSHNLIEGQTVKVNVPFQLAGGLLMFPADSSLGVSFNEVVNCRCYALYF